MACDKFPSVARRTSVRLRFCRIAHIPAPALRYEPTGLWVEFSYPQPSEGATTDQVTDPVTDPVETLIIVLGDRDKSEGVMPPLL
jgi:hypothetical protein